MGSKLGVWKTYFHGWSRRRTHLLKEKALAKGGDH